MDNGFDPSSTSGIIIRSLKKLQGDLPSVCLGNLPANGFPLFKQVNIVLFPVYAYVFYYTVYTTQKVFQTSIMIANFFILYTLSKKTLRNQENYLCRQNIHKRNAILERKDVMKRRKFITKYSYTPWYRTTRRVCEQLILPFTVFQLIRTLFIPTVFDVLLLSIFIAIAVSIYFEIV